MKIVHVTSSLGRDAAGVRQVIIELAKEQISHGHVVRVIGLNCSDNDELYEDWHDVPVVVLKSTGPKKLGYSKIMEQAIREINPDVVHLHGLWMHPGRSVLKWHNKTNGKYIVSPHGMLSKVALSYSPVKKKIVSWWFQNKVFQKASAIHVTCEAEKKDVINYGINKFVEIIPNGVNVVELPSKTLKNYHTLISLGRIHKQKALDRLLKAWALVEFKYPNWKLSIVGPDVGNEVARLTLLKEKLSLNNVDISGPVYGSEKNSILRNADAFILPSHSENFALTVTESLMLEVPVISSKGAPWSELNHKECGLWVSNDIISLSSAIEKIIRLTDLERNVMGQKGRAWVKEEFAWDAISRKFDKLYNNVLTQQHTCVNCRVPRV